MNEFYIDIPYEYHYDWKIAKDCQEVLRVQEGFATVIFIANRDAKLSAGDLYKVTLKEDDCPEFFVLRKEYKFVSKEIIENRFRKK